MRRPLVVLVGAIAALAPIGSAGVAAAGGAVPGTTGGGAVPGGFGAVRLVPRPLLATGVRDDTVTSTNWSGYAVGSSRPFTDVVGTWVQPAATCSFLSRSYSSFWTGLDGYSSTSVEQLGTDADCSAFGATSYYAWWEMYPAGSVALSTSIYPVSPGDTLTGEVSRSGSSYSLMLTSSRGWRFSTTQSGSDADSSAEWVAEAPEVCTLVFCRVANLTDFGSVTFSGSVAAAGGTGQPISSFTAGGGPHEMAMVTGSGATKAQPGALTGAGTGFTDTWHHA